MKLGFSAENRRNVARAGANEMQIFRWRNEIRTRRNTGTITTAGCSRERARSPFDRPLFSLYRCEIRDVPQATVTNVFVYRQPGGRRGCHPRMMRNARKCREGVETVLGARRL